MTLARGRFHRLDADLDPPTAVSRALLQTLRAGLQNEPSSMYQIASESGVSRLR